MSDYIKREAAIAAAFSANAIGNSAFRDVCDTVKRIRMIPAEDVRIPTGITENPLDENCLPKCGNHYKRVKPMTNADRIRAMNDDKLAELLRDTQCNTCAWQGNDCDYADECKAEKLEMLKQECDDNGT